MEIVQRETRCRPSRCVERGKTVNRHNVWGMSREQRRPKGRRKMCQAIATVLPRGLLLPCRRWAKPCLGISPFATARSQWGNGGGRGAACWRLWRSWRTDPGGLGDVLSRSHQDQQCSFLEAKALRPTTGWSSVVVINQEETPGNKWGHWASCMLTESWRMDST